jgi:hypothetical protein
MYFCDQICGLTSFQSSATTLVAIISSRSFTVSSRSGIGVSQMSASSPTWWLQWPVSICPPRGCAMSPTSNPLQPTAGTLLAKRSRKLIRFGWPQLRLRDSRITCQVLPVTGSATAPARQPLV